MAVYTEISDDELIKFLLEYDIGEVLACKGIADGIENTNYALATTAGAYILTLYEKRVCSADLPFFLALMDHLAGANIPCPTPVRGKNGSALHHLSGKPAAIVTFLEGEGTRQITNDHCRQLGHALACLHLAGANFTPARPNSLSVEGWRVQLEKCNGRVDEISPGLEEFLHGQLDDLSSQWPENLPTGIIHADLFPDNVFFRDNQLSGIIDFYFACTDMLAYDIAICLNAWCFDADANFDTVKARELLRAYQNVRELNKAEIAALPILVRGASLRFAMTRVYDWLYTPIEALVTRKDPLEYIDKLRFHCGITEPDDYGLEIR